MTFKERLQAIAGWFQPNYDRIKAWDLSDDAKELLDGIWDSLSPTIQNALWKLVKEVYEENQEKAKELLKKMLKELGKIFKIS